MNAPQVLSRFRGSLLGVLVGDCCGAPFHGQTIIESGERIVLRKYFDKLEGPFFRAPQKSYTDDTVMTQGVCRTLIDHGQIDQTALCKDFVREYTKQSNRLYGEDVTTVFQKLRVNKFENVLGPATEQFGGSGSYGNGGAMRVAPAALFCHAKPADDVTHFARQATVPTHTHPHGVNGAILQALAVHAAFQLNPNEPLDIQLFLDNLETSIQKVEAADDDLDMSTPTPYVKQLQKISKLLRKSPSEVEVVNLLGNEVAALFSVPTAIYCFLRSFGDIPGIQTTNPFRRAVEFAISLGGDTDTIASMCGAISGAFYGDMVIAENLVKHCESNEEMLVLANGLYEASQKV